MLHISGLVLLNTNYQGLVLINTNYHFVMYLTYSSHSTGTTQWVDPRLAQVKKATVDECDDDGKCATAIYYSTKNLVVEQSAFCTALVAKLATCS